MSPSKKCLIGPWSALIGRFLYNIFFVLKIFSELSAFERELIRAIRKSEIFTSIKIEKYGGFHIFYSITKII